MLSPSWRAFSKVALCRLYQGWNGLLRCQLHCLFVACLLVLFLFVHGLASSFVMTAVMTWSHLRHLLVFCLQAFVIMAVV